MVFIAVSSSHGFNAILKGGAKWINPSLFQAYVFSILPI
jgi:hypothetical protein